MNTTALWHLTWKEYRAVRPFWLSMVGLILSLQAMIGFFSTEPNWTLMALCNLALAGPAFFAVGAAGTAFAIEHEDGTYDFLRSVPVSSREIFVSKFGLAVAATLAMLLVLVPLTLVWTGLSLPVKVSASELAGLWVMASLEAIAWGTLFSLLLQRPLPAVCLALVATSTAAHALAGLEHEGRVITFQFSAYSAALGWRIALTAAVLAVDVVLGLRWMRTTGDAAVQPVNRAKTTEMEPSTKPWAASREQAKDLVERPERFNMISRLVWQNLRQSWRMMLLLAGLQIFLFIVAIQFSLGNGFISFIVLVPLVGIASLMGSSVFLADQERRHYRFFVEHNVPARYVWFTRNAMWIALVLLTTMLLCNAWGISYRLGMYPPIASALTWVVIGYAAGQWSSMHVRSGLLAGFVGLVLCGLLCAWAFLIERLGESWWLFIAPIPLVLMAATWLRAPDWIREKTTTRARLRVAGAVLAPAACLMAMLPVSRVTQVPKSAAPFDVASYEAEVTPAGLETAALYRRASELLVGFRVDPGSRLTWDDQAEWLADNAEPLRLLLEASRRQNCFLFDFRQNPDPTPLHAQALINLLDTSGQQLERAGKLDEALDRYFDMIRCVSHWAQHAPFTSSDLLPHRYSAFSKFGAWAAREGQTPERISGAIQRLSAIDTSVLHLNDGIKSDYLLGQLLLTDPLATSWRLGQRELFEPHTMMALRFMPWEYQRERLLLESVTKSGLLQLSQASEALEDGVGLVAHPVYLRLSMRQRRFPLNLVEDLRVNNNAAIQILGDFESDRRAEIIVLAVQQYRLLHGEFPDSLDDLVGSILPALPVDPYSGISFRYIANSTALSAAEKAEVERVHLNLPIIWGTGASLRTEPANASILVKPTPDSDPAEAVSGYARYLGDWRGYGNEWENTLRFITSGRLYSIPKLKGDSKAPAAVSPAEGAPATAVDELLQ